MNEPNRTAKQKWTHQAEKKMTKGGSHKGLEMP